MKVRKNIVFPKKVVVAFEEGKCNLACPKCPVHGKNKRDKIVKGILPEKLAIKIAKELENKKGVILGLGGAVEPLAQKTFFKYVVMRYCSEQILHFMHYNILSLTRKIINQENVFLIIV